MKIKLSKEIKKIEECFLSWKITFKDNSEEYFLENNGFNMEFLK